MSSSANPAPSLTEQEGAKIVPLNPDRYAQPRRHARIAVLRDQRLVSTLRLSPENRFLRVVDYTKGPYLHAPDELIGRLLDECWEPELLDHWTLALDWCRAYNTEIPITYEWACEETQQWILRLATFHLRPRGTVDVYVRHVGARPIQIEELGGPNHAKS